MSQNRNMNERFIVRLPDGLRDTIRATAEQNRRSMNSEIVLALEKTFNPKVADGARA